VDARILGAKTEDASAALAQDLDIEGVSLDAEMFFSRRDGFFDRLPRKLNPFVHRLFLLWRDSPFFAGARLQPCRWSL
jgi:hypothetical protein